MADTNLEWKHLSVELRRTLVDIVTGRVPDVTVTVSGGTDQLGKFRRSLFDRAPNPSIMCDLVELVSWANRNSVTTLDLHEMLRQTRMHMERGGTPNVERSRIILPGQ